MLRVRDFRGAYRCFEEGDGLDKDPMKTLLWMMSKMQSDRWYWRESDEQRENLGGKRDGNARDFT